MKAAVLRAFNQPLAIEEVEVPEPHAGEVLVKVVATGVCHSDLHVIKGDIQVPLPVVLGHEGAGIVEKVGPGVTTVSPGDHVVLAVLPSCGQCAPCVGGRPYICERSWPVIFSGTMMDGTRRLRNREGEELSHLFAQSSFAEYAVVTERSAVPIRKEAPLEKMAVLGCGATTGIGAVLNTARVEAGTRVAVVGCGGVGLSVILGAKLAGALQIIGVDISKRKLRIAQDFGATHTIDSSREDLVQRVQELTEGGADYVFECVGHPDLMSQSFDATRAGGKTVIVGAAPMGAKVSVDALSLLMEKTLVGTPAGSLRPAIDIPRYVNLYLEGKLELDRLVTCTYPLEKINEAFGAMQRGEVARSVIVYA
ncbi:MAG: Zn-dependent alcohol dehydrogenase [Nitrospinae bacterium]|nr:Zn-dependent alcohol dehydrogenase [Nitrospinota bacterium]